MFFYALLFVFTLLLLEFCWSHTSRKRILIHKIPGPPGLPIIGNLFLGLIPTDRVWDEICWHVKKYGSTVKAYIGHYTLIGISDPEDVEILLSSQQHLEKGFAYDNLHPWLKTGLLTSHGEKWKQRRRILTSAFHFNILKKYLDITNENATKFVQSLGSESNEKIHSLTQLCSNYTLSIICESAMGVKLDKLPKEEELKYKNAIQTMGDIVVYRVIRPYIRNWMMNFLWRLKSLQTKTLNVLHNFTNEVLMERKEYHRRTEYKYLKDITEDDKNTDDIVYGGRKKRLAMLDLLLSAEMDNLIDDEGIKEELDTFMFEGHDTTAMAMTFALMLLAENKEIQDKARAEVTEVLDKTGGKLEFSDIQQLTYLEQCIKESLRLYPPVAIISRYITKELQLKTCIIPEKTEVFILNYHVHRHSNHWEEPDKFDPDRFLPERTQGRHPFSYVPFSAGPRNCIGQKFALMELKSLLAQILYNFRLEPIDKTADMKLLFNMIMRPAHPVRVKFIKIRDCV